MLLPKGTGAFDSVMKFMPAPSSRRHGFAKKIQTLRGEFVGGETLLWYLYAPLVEVGKAAASSGATRAFSCPEEAAPCLKASCHITAVP